MELYQMPLNLSIKNAPEDVVKKLRDRAKRHHRSLQGELLAIIEESVRSEERLSPEEVLEEVRRLSLHTPSESLEMIRADRNSR
jgi:plasmid stability protein